MRSDPPVKVIYGKPNFLGNPEYTHQILTLDQSYVRSICLNYFGDSFIEKVHRVLDIPYVKPEFVCSLCKSGNNRKGHRPASFYPHSGGYLYTCLVCEPSLPLYQYLRQENPEVADKYQKDRWLKKLTGGGFNCPRPPRNIRKEHYQRIEREQKERNQMEYKKKYGLR